MYVIRITFHGRDVLYRRGAIVRFKTLREARLELERIKPALDPGEVAVIVPWRKGMH